MSIPRITMQTPTVWKNLEKALRVLATLPLLLVTRLDPIEPPPPPAATDAAAPPWWWCALCTALWAEWAAEEEKMKPAAALEIWASQALSREAVEATGAKESVRWRPPTQRAWVGWLGLGWVGVGGPGATI